MRRFLALAALALAACVHPVKNRLVVVTNVCFVFDSTVTDAAQLGPVQPCPSVHINPAIDMPAPVYLFLIMHETAHVKLGHYATPDMAVQKRQEAEADCTAIEQIKQNWPEIVPALLTYLPRFFIADEAHGSIESRMKRLINCKGA